jgi:RNA polymerase sigma-70 factor (ECF subfamily)
MDELAERFEQHRTHLRAVAYRMLGSLSEADDAVQETWLRLSRDDRSDVENLGAWLTTVVARVSLNMLRSRNQRREASLDDVFVPEPVVDRWDGTSPEHEALLADSVGLALFVVLETLPPAERLAFVLHDMFAVPFDEIAPIVDRSPEAARQLASRGRRRLRGAPAPDTDLAAQQEVVAAYMAAARDGDFDRLVSILDPDVVLRVDRGAVPPRVPRELRGAEAVIGQARMYSRLDLQTRQVVVNGGAGAIAFKDGKPFAIVGITVRGGRIVELDFLADPERLAQVDLSRL